MSLDKKDASPKPFSLGSAAWVRALERIAPLRDHAEQTFPVLVSELAERHGNAPALVSARETVSFRELAARVNRYRRWTLEQDFAPGTVVGLLMHNQPDYPAIWLGLTQAGCVAALLNTHLSGASLAHCLDVAGVKHVIAGEGFGEARALALPLCKSCPEARGSWSAGSWLPLHQVPGRPAFRYSSSKDGEKAYHPRRSRALHLYQRNDRASESGQCQPPPGHVLQLLVRWHDGYKICRPAV